MNPQEMMKKVGKKIQLYRNRNNLTQEQLAEKIDVSQSKMSRMERGDTLPDGLALIKMVDEFGITPNELLQDVVKAGYTIKACYLAEAISVLPAEEQERILELIEFMITKAKKK